MVSFRSFCKIISYLVEKNYILLKEQWIHLNVGVNDVKTSLKLILLLVVSMEKHVKLIIAWTVMKNFLCTFLLVTKVKKNNTLVKLLITFVADEIILSLKVKVLKEEESACKNICEGHSEFLDDISIILID